MNRRLCCSFATNGRTELSCKTDAVPMTEHGPRSRAANLTTPAEIQAPTRISKGACDTEPSWRQPLGRMANVGDLALSIVVVPPSGSFGLISNPPFHVSLIDDQHPADDAPPRVARYSTWLRQSVIESVR